MIAPFKLLRLFLLLRNIAKFEKKSFFLTVAKSLSRKAPSLESAFDCS